MELYNDFEDARRGQPSESARSWNLMKDLSDWAKELKGLLAVKDRELMGESSRANALEKMLTGC